MLNNEFRFFLYSVSSMRKIIGKCHGIIHCQTSTFNSQYIECDNCVEDVRKSFSSTYDAMSTPAG
jgi:hypothetical protein